MWHLLRNQKQQLVDNSFVGEVIGSTFGPNSIEKWTKKPNRSWVPHFRGIIVVVSPTLTHPARHPWTRLGHVVATSSCSRIGAECLPASGSRRTPIPWSTSSEPLIFVDLGRFDSQTKSLKIMARSKDYEAIYQHWRLIFFDLDRELKFLTRFEV